jgi:hypothetical protein
MKTIEQLVKKWYRQARVDADPANGNALLQKLSQYETKMADELEAALSADGPKRWDGIADPKAIARELEKCVHWREDGKFVQFDWHRVIALIEDHDRALLASHRAAPTEAPRHPEELRHRPTIAELEEILNSEEPLKVVVLPDGSISAEPPTVPQPTQPQSIIVGIVAKHAIITPTCRENRTPCAAFEEAISRVFDEYMECINTSGNEKVNYHLVLTVERPAEPPAPGTAKKHES